MSDDSHPDPDRVLDARGLSCPLPLLRAGIALDELEPGRCLRVDATDPHALADFRAFCERTGHVLLAHSETEGVHTFLLRRR